MLTHLLCVFFLPVMKGKMAYTLQQQLTAVESAIYTMMNGGAIRDYSTALGVRISKCSLTELSTWRDNLKREIAGADSSGGRNYATFADPS